MKNQPGYPLPDGDLGSDEIVCQLVFLPNRPEYWQAFVSSLHYLATWRAWERDDARRGKDAAGDWRIANELTMGCWRMACLQDLQDNVAEILAIMQLGNQCCDDQDITDGDRYTDRVEDGEGDVPQPIIDAGYATDVADWEGFDDYKCMIVHVTVNQMESRLREIDEIVDRAGPYLALAAALSAIIGVIVTAGGLAIVFGMLAGIGVVSALYYALIEFGPVDDLADDVAANHEELACAMYNADGDEGSLVALNDKIDELFSVPEALILKNLNLGPTLKALYAGRYDQQDIAEELEVAGYDVGDFNCFCDIIELNGWRLYEDPIIHMEQSVAPPGCTTNGQKQHQVWQYPEGSGLLDGDFRIKGYYLITGDITLGGDCTGSGLMQLKLHMETDWQTPDYPGSPTYEYVHYNNGNHTPGTQNFRYDFEFTRAFENVRWITLTRRMQIEFGSCHAEMEMIITEIEHTV